MQLVGLAAGIEVDSLPRLMTATFLALIGGGLFNVIVGWQVYQLLRLHL